MGHLVKKLPWGEIDLDTTNPRIFFQQRWKYAWNVRPPMAPWSYLERRDFHNTLDRQIWSRWSNRAAFTAMGASDFCRRASAMGIPINLDVKWVNSNEHWLVEAWKLRPGERERAWVDFGARRIWLHNNLNARTACNDAGVCRAGFRTVPHEFGHAINSDDEYQADSANLADAQSIMNIGRQLRERHFQSIIDELNTMMPGCTFAIRSIHN